MNFLSNLVHQHHCTPATHGRNRKWKTSLHHGEPAPGFHPSEGAGQVRGAGHPSHLFTDYFCGSKTWTFHQNLIPCMICAPLSVVQVWKKVHNGNHSNHRPCPKGENSASFRFFFFFFPQPFFCSICCAPKAWTFYHTLRIEVWLHLLSIGVSFMTNRAFPQKLGFWENSQVFWSSEGAGHPSHFSLQTFSECLRHELSIKTWYKAWFELHYPWCKFGRKFSPGNPPTGNHTGKKSENSRSFRFFGPVSKFWVFCVPKTWTFSHTLSKYVIFDFLSIGVGFRSGT